MLNMNLIQLVHVACLNMGDWTTLEDYSQFVKEDDL